MNKKLLLALVLFISLFIIGCGNPLANSDYTGIWYAKQNGKISELITINQDGTIKYADFTSKYVKKLSKNKFEAKFNMGSKTETFTFEFSSNNEGIVKTKKSNGNIEIVKKYILVPSYFMDTNNFFI